MLWWKKSCANELPTVWTQQAACYWRSGALLHLINMNAWHEALAASGVTLTPAVYFQRELLWLLRCNLTEPCFSADVSSLYSWLSCGDRWDRLLFLHPTCYTPSIPTFHHFSMYWKSCQTIFCFAYCKLSELLVQWSKSRHFCKAPFFFFLPIICALSCQWRFNLKCFIKELQAVSPLHNPALFVLYNKLWCCDDRLLCCFPHQNRLNTASRAA